MSNTCDFPGCTNATLEREHYCDVCSDEMRPPRVD